MTAETGLAKDQHADELTDTQVRDYLQQHTDFFEKHPDMLDYLHIAHGSGSAVSLVEKQVSVLRERNMDMRKRLNTLTANARENDRLYEQTRKLILALLEASDLAAISAAYYRSMGSDFAVEHASIILFGDPRDCSGQLRVESADSARIEIGALLKNRKGTCGALRREELCYLFPGAGELGSAAVMPLHRGDVDIGVIAVGSNDPNYYSASMGTLFLGHIAEVLVRHIPRL